MNIAELFVRVRADVTDVNRRMREIEGAMGGVERASKSTGLQTGRLGNQFANLAGQIARVHPIVGNLAGVLGNFAIGAGLTVGVLAGVAAVAVVYDKLTASSRKAMEAGDKLAETYNRAAKIKAFGGQQLADIDTMNKGLEQHNKWLGFIIAARVQLGSMGGLLGGMQKGQSDAITANTKAIAEAEQQRANEYGLAVAKANDAWAARNKKIAEEAAAAAKKAQSDFLAAITSSLAVFDNLASHGTSSSVINAKLIEDYKKITAQIREMGNASTPAALELLKLRDALAANLVVAREIARVNSTGTVGPLVGKSLPGVGFTPSAPEPGKPMPKVGSPSDPIVKVETAVERQTRLEGEYQARLRQTISDTAAQIASVVGSAVLSIGSGKGAQVGAAIGGAFGSGVGGMAGAAAATAIGGYLGAGVGSVIPVVGTLIGAYIGSKLGGLFDSHKKEVTANTNALKANTAALLLRAPTGFKTANYRYDATEVKKMADAARRLATRGGSPIFGVT